MEIDYDYLEQCASVLEELVDEMPHKIKEETLKVIKDLKSKPSVEKLLKIQDDLESISSMNVNNFTRNEVMNVVAEIESIVNS